MGSWHLIVRNSKFSLYQLTNGNLLKFLFTVQMKRDHNSRTGFGDKILGNVVSKIYLVGTCSMFDKIDFRSSLQAIFCHGIG